MFGILAYLILSNPVGIGGLQTMNLEIQNCENLYSAKEISRDRVVIRFKLGFN
jgi:hypothetical protein